MQQEKPNHNNNNISFLAGISAAVVVVLIGSGWWAIHTITASNKPSIPTMLVPGTSQDNVKTGEQIAEVYWLKATDKSLEFVPLPVTMEKSAQPDALLETMLKRLLVGIQTKDYTTAIPKGTKLHEVKIANNEVYVNLSQQFTSGGGSASMIGRLGQIIYTATSLNPKAKVWLQVDGKNLETLGGEGLMLEQPLTRQYFEANMINFAE